jgi:ATP-binding cassette, subfamily B, bacterial
MEMAADPIQRAGTLLPKLQKASAAAGRVTALLSVAVPEDPPEAIRPARIRGQVTMTDLHFRHPTALEEALRGITFTVQPGERLAIVGPIGAGKSTLLELLLKLQLPTLGNIRIDEHDLVHIRTERWRELCGLVPQEVLLLNRSVAENITLGLPEGRHDLERVAQLAGLDETVRRLPRGYETVVGERGAFLSGGERQRIAMARLFLRNPQIILLDEPTSALDVESEANLLPALERLCAGRTTLVVSHRPLLLRNVDKVLLLAEGTQVAFGTPEEVWQRFPDWRKLLPSRTSP